MKTALIIGIDSNIGALLQQELIAAGHTVFGTTRRKKSTNSHSVSYLDLLEHENFSFKSQVDAVYLCAAITKVASCRNHSSHVQAINVEAQVALAKYFISQNSQVIFLSTSAVFNGEKNNYNEYDPTAPISAYGEYKAHVEKKLLALSTNITIVRLTKVLTPNYPLIIEWINKLSKNQEINAFNDLVLCPISVSQITRCLKIIGERRLTGIFHLSGKKDVTYYELAKHLANLIGVNQTLVQPVSAASAGIIPEEAPRYTQLAVTRAEKIFNINNTPVDALLTQLYGNIPCNV